MRKTAKMISLEERFGKPIEDILKEHYEKYGTSAGPRFLGIEASTLYRWMCRLGLSYHIRREVEQREIVQLEK